GLLRALRIAERRAALRGLSVDPRRGHEPPPPLDSRRLAARRVVAVARPRSRQRPREEPAFRALALEALRQPATQPRAAGVDRDAAPRMDRAPRCLALDADSARDSRAALGERLCPRAAAQARGDA